ncbi:MAG: hypothetical protein ABJN72_13480 [Sulfitobacter sp.]
MEKLAYIIIGVSMGILAMTLLPMTHTRTQTPAAMDHSAMAMGTADNPAMDVQAMSAMHQHPPRSVREGLPVPAVNHLMFPDIMDGYNVQIITQNFTFTPAAINRAPKDNEGHAHIYVNDTKIARIYGNWYHLPAEMLASGDNKVRVTLNANDHSEWAVDGVPISSTVNIQVPVPSQ